MTKALKEAQANCSSALLDEHVRTENTENNSQTNARRVVSPVSWRSVAQECQSLSEISLPKKGVTSSGTHELKVNLNVNQDQKVNISYTKSSRGGFIRSYANIQSIKNLPEENRNQKTSNGFGSVRSSTKLIVHNDIKTEISDPKLATHNSQSKSAIPKNESQNQLQPNSD